MPVYQAVTPEWLAFRIQSGTITFTSAAAILVTFPNAFGSVPKIALTMRSDPGQSKRPIQTYGTTTQFTVSFGSTVTCVVDWLAVAGF